MSAADGPLSPVTVVIAIDGSQQALQAFDCKFCCVHNFIQMISDTQSHALCLCVCVCVTVSDRKLTLAVSLCCIDTDAPTRQPDGPPSYLIIMIMDSSTVLLLLAWSVDCASMVR